MRTTEERTEEMIKFYAEALDKDMNSGRQEFITKVCNYASDIENIDDENERQTTIMENILHVFDDISMKDRREESAWHILDFRGFDSDVLTNWELKQIQGVCHDHYPNVVKSCQTIIEEGF